MQIKTSGNSACAIGLSKCWIVLALAVLVFASTGSSCKKKDSANENNENNTNATSDASPTPAASAEPTTSTAAASFQGNWVNKDPNTANNTRLVIAQTGSELKVHAWGKCHPTDCDWGEETGGIVDDAGVVTWDQKFVIRKMKLTLEGNNELRSVTESVYSDNRPRRRSEEVFVKQ